MNMNNKYTLGKLVKQSREEKGILREDLVKGLMSEKTLRKVEKDEIILDKFSWDFLLHRLGISTAIYECYVTQWEFFFYELQTKIRELVNKCIEILYTKKEKEKGEVIQKYVEEGRAYCKQYRIVLEEKKRIEGIYPAIHLLFLGVMESYFLISVREKLHIRKKQIQNTWSIFHEEGWEKLIDRKGVVCLSLQELELLILWSEIYEEEGKREQAKRLLTWICEYCCNHYDDEEEQVKIYPYAVWYLAVLEGRDNNEEYALNIVIKSMKKLVGVRSLHFFIPTIDIQLQYVDNDSYVTWYKRKQLLEYKECVLSICKEYEENPYRVYPFTTIENAILVTEIIKQKRKDLNMTQAQLCEDIVEPETMSRFERGKLNIRWRTLSLILQRLELPCAKEQLIIESSGYKI